MGATPVEGVPAILDALVQRVDKMDTSVRERLHKLSNDVAIVHEDGRVHSAEDEGRFTAVETSLVNLGKSIDGVASDVTEVRDDMRTAADRVVSAADKQADRSSADRRWLIGIGVTILLAVGGSYILTRDRVSDLENSRDAGDRTLDRLERRLDGIGDRLGVQAPTPP